MSSCSLFAPYHLSAASVLSQDGTACDFRSARFSCQLLDPGADSLLSQHWINLLCVMQARSLRRMGLIEKAVQTLTALLQRDPENQEVDLTTHWYLFALMSLVAVQR